MEAKALWPLGLCSAPLLLVQLSHIVGWGKTLSCPHLHPTHSTLDIFYLCEITIDIFSFSQNEHHEDHWEASYKKIANPFLHGYNLLGLGSITGIYIVTVKHLISKALLKISKLGSNINTSVLHISWGWFLTSLFSQSMEYSFIHFHLRFYFPFMCIQNWPNLFPHFITNSLGSGVFPQSNRVCEQEMSIGLENAI